MLHGNAGQDGVVNRAESIQHRLSELASGAGAGGFPIALALLLVLDLVVGSARARGDVFVIGRRTRAA